MRILISGSSGLIGSALCVALAEQGHEIIRLVRSKEADGVY
ncbi:MAG TPA: NAD-dependent epimerase/dehydratase family protein, partial [bacterium]|nr:NAD-dependent epimerase/dehydratase family protein [bacterium]